MQIMHCKRFKVKSCSPTELLYSGQISLKYNLVNQGLDIYDGLFNHSTTKVFLNMPFRGLSQITFAFFGIF